MILHARLGRSTGSLEIQPTEATTVQIALVAQRTRNTGMRRADPEQSSGQGSSMRTGDLKIPSIFQQ